MSAGVRRGHASRLLFPSCTYWHGTDRGIEWVTSFYGIARRDLLRAPSTYQHKLAPITSARLRYMLDRFRSEPVLGDAAATKTVLPGFTGKPNGRLLIASGTVMASVDPQVWAGWSATGLQPRLTARGTVLWYGRIRGKEALFGAFLPIRPDWDYLPVRTAA